MKHYLFFLAASFVLFASCGQNIRSAEGNAAQGDSVSLNQPAVDKTLSVKMQIKEVIKFGEPVQLKFTVYNNADSVLVFCKWHTPFEPLMSKYLNVKNEKGEELGYKGPMAKRVMPPPAESYIQVKAKDSLSADVDVLKAYAITQPGKYTIVYNADSISGLTATDSVTFVYQ